MNPDLVLLRTEPGVDAYLAYSTDTERITWVGTLAAARAELTYTDDWFARARDTGSSSPTAYGLRWEQRRSVDDLIAEGHDGRAMYLPLDHLTAFVADILAGTAQAVVEARYTTPNVGRA